MKKFLGFLFVSVAIITFLFNYNALLPRILYENDLIKGASEEESIDSYSIKWIGQFSSNEDFNKNPRFGKRVFDFIFGEDIFVFTRPFAIVADNSGFYWILDQGRRLPVKINTSNGNFDLLINSKYYYFPSLVGICFKNKEIIFTDSKYNKIFILKDKDDINSLQILNDSLDLKQPTGIAYSKVNKEIWVIETASHCISILDENGIFLRRVGKRGNEPGEFNFPTFIWIDNQGFVYIVDSMNFRVQIFSPDGKLASFFGEQGDGTGYLASPKGISTDSKGNIYIVDALFHTVQIFDKSGRFLYNFGKQGKGDGEFWIPTGIYIDEKDVIYIADSYNSRIQMFQLFDNK